MKMMLLTHQSYRVCFTINRLKTLLNSKPDREVPVSFQWDIYMLNRRQSIKRKIIKILVVTWPNRQDAYEIS